MNLWNLSAQEMLELPVDAVALLVLEDFSHGGWNVDSYCKERADAHGQHFQSPGVAQRLTTAWQGREANVLIGRNPVQESPNARAVTEIGREALRAGEWLQQRARSRGGRDIVLLHRQVVVPALAGDERHLVRE